MPLTSYFGRYQLLLTSVFVMRVKIAPGAKMSRVFPAPMSYLPVSSRRAFANLLDEREEQSAKE